MLHKNTLSFLKDIKANNHKQWLEANRAKYENAKEDFGNLVNDIIKGISKFDSSMEILTAKDCTFRLNRDIRFSKDKSPYKTNFGAGFNAGGKKAINAGYYLHIEPGQSFIGGGFWMPPAFAITKIRQEIDYNFDEWNTIISSKKFKTNFTKGLDMEGALKRSPKGYEDDNPAIKYLKLKSYTITKPLGDEEIILPTLKKNIADTFKSMQPFLNFLNNAIQ